MKIPQKRDSKDTRFSYSLSFDNGRWHVDCWRKVKDKEDEGYWHKDYPDTEDGRARAWKEYNRFD